MGKWLQLLGGILWGCGPGAGIVRADPGHEKVIADLTAQLSLSPAEPRLYFQRGWNYREMPQMEAARLDFLKALALDPAFLPAERELARLEADGGDLAGACARLRNALTRATGRPAAEVAGVAALLAEYALFLNEAEQACAAAIAGLAVEGGLTADLLLAKAEALRRLGRGTDRVECLEKAAPLHSSILDDALTDALLDEKLTDRAAVRIEAGLSEARRKAPWLLRRSRLRTLTGDQEAAAADLKAALQELDQQKPGGDGQGAQWWCDQGVARVLSGNPSGARLALGEALAAGAESWRLRVLESLLPLPSPRRAGTLPPLDNKSPEGR